MNAFFSFTTFRRCYSQKAPKPKSPILHRLDPTRLRSSDHLDISSLTQSRLFVLREILRDDDYEDRYTPVVFRYFKEKGVQHNFPPRTAGFFYYHRPPSLPFTAGAIRFRVAAVNPTTFSQGNDLLGPDGSPWEVSLPRLARSRPLIRQMLLRERLVTLAQLKQCGTLMPHANSRPPRVLLQHFDQPFPVSFTGQHYIQIVSGGKTYRSDIRVFHEQRKGSNRYVYPYTGRALLRYELSTLPQHQTTPTVVLRIVKIIEPPRPTIPGYDGHLPIPIEGELVQRAGRGHVVERHPWCRKLTSTPLRLLLKEEEDRKGS
ncbi:hypothetical protein FB45DRAFT_753976 [Roridomyces roridus]|uniref:Uncharacterized protein n=1 Tax=Roridomyces roridus TaxID=1738132 RepID=A0AAD7BGX6_9AGAR|nr:hypothetical protein FB45DRAFT_753976 [Roridomyces roridus]